MEYALVRQEAEESRALYENLLKRLKEAGVLEGLHSSNITVVDPGREPAKPKRPEVLFYMAISAGIGLLLGCLAAVLADTLDNKINTIAEVEELIGKALLGATPFVKPPLRSGSSSLNCLAEPHSTHTEALRAIRTALFLTGGKSEQGSRVILVTSSIPGEGKTTLSANLAVVLAQAKRRVLLVDMDMRRGTLRHKLGLDARAGLSDLLAAHGTVTLSGDLFPSLPNLHVLLAGAVPPNPSELLEFGMKKWIDLWRKEYDFIVLDSPPVLPVTDAVVIHPLADITLLLARVQLTERAQVKQSFRTLIEADDHYTGVVLNGLRPNDESYYGYYGYREEAYGYMEVASAPRR